MSEFDVRSPDWSSPHFQALHQLLAEAYDSPSKAQTIAASVPGFRGLNEVVWENTTADEVWRQIVAAATRNACLPPLLDAVLNDRSRSAFHEPLKDIQIRASRGTPTSLGDEVQRQWQTYGAETTRNRLMGEFNRREFERRLHVVTDQEGKSRCSNSLLVDALRATLDELSFRSSMLNTRTSAVRLIVELPDLRSLLSEIGDLLTEIRREVELQSLEITIQARRLAWIADMEDLQIATIGVLPAMHTSSSSNWSSSGVAELHQAVEKMEAFLRVNNDPFRIL